MRKDIKKVTAWLLLSGLVVTSSGIVTLANDAIITQTNPFVTSENDATGNVFYLTADMVSEDGTIVVEKGEWQRIVIPKELQAKKITLKDISVQNLEIEGGTDCVLDVTGGTIGNVVVFAPQIKTMGQKEIKELLASGKPSNEVAQLYREYQKEKAKLQSLVPTIVTDKGTAIGTMKISTSINLNLSQNNVGNIEVESVSNQSKMQVEITNYTGSVTIKQEKEAKKGNNLLNLTLTDSIVTKLDMNSTGGSTCYIKEKGTSKVEKVAVTGNSRVNLSVPVETVTVTKQAEDAFVKLYNDAKEIVVEGKKTEIMLSSSATVENAVVSGDNVKIYGHGKLNAADIKGEEANVSTSGTKVEGENDKTVPSNIATPIPTSKPSKPTVPSVPTTKPEDTKPSTPGALVTPTPTPEGTITPKPEENVKNEYDANGKLIKTIYYDNAGNVKHYDLYEYYTNGQVKQRTRYNINEVITWYVKYNEEGKTTESFSLTYGPNDEVMGFVMTECDVHGKAIKRVWHDLSGNIEEIDELEYDVNGNNIKKISYDALGNITSIYKYSETGKKVEEQGFHYNQGKLEFSYKAEFNSDGKQIKFTEYDAEGNMIGYSICEYNGNNEKIKEVYYNAENIMTSYGEYEYHSNGVLKEERSYNANGQINYSSKYNENEILIEYVFYYYRQGVLQEYTKEEFNSNGDVIKETNYDAQGNIEDYKVYEYNDNNEQIKWTYYSASSEIVSYTLLEYHDNGELKQTAYYSKEGLKELQKFDENGVRLERQWYNYIEIDDTITVYSYEIQTYENGKLIKDNFYNVYNQIGYCIIYEYNADGYKIKELNYNDMGDLTGYSTYEYHSNGEVKEEINYESNGDILLWLLKSNVLLYLYNHSIL